MTDDATQPPTLVPLYRTVDAFMAGLEAAGVDHVIISPGSRSTPLAVTARRRPGMTTEIVLDERAAAFVALGRAQATRTTVGLICTSGTAAANYLPAIVEASLSRVPLVVMTADRPPELWGWDAGQTIDQTHLYGRYPREFVQMPVGALDPGRAERMAYRAGAVAAGSTPGPVHINWPFRQPFDPPQDWLEGGAHHASRLGRPSAVGQTADLSEMEALLGRRRGLIVAGPWRPTIADREAVLRFSTSVGWPIVADPLSQLRTAPGVAPVIDSADVLMRSGATEGLTPEVVVRVGAMPTSKALRLWLERNQPRHVVLFDPDGRWSDPSAMFTIRLPVSVSALAGLAVSPVDDRSWAETWTGRGQTARAVVDEVLDAGPLRELRATRAVSDVLGANDSLVVGSSMPVRDLDLVMRARVGGPRVFANRGANGIDGTIATAAGVASGGSPTTVLLGDLAFIHDLGGLHAAAQKDLDMTVVVMNNAGGGIFSHLPIAGLGAAAFFDELFGTPQRFEFAGAAALVGADYVLADSVDVFDSALTGSSRLRVIEVPLDHREDLAQMHEVVAAVGEKSR